MTRLVSAVRCALVAVLLLTVGPPARAEIVDRVLVQVEDGIITQTDVIRFLPIYTQVVGLTPAAFGSLEACATTVQDFVRFLVEAHILVDDATARELSVTSSEVEDYIAQQYGRLGMTREQFVGELHATGISFDDFREFMELNLTRMRMLQVDVGGRVSVSDAELDRAIDELYPDGLEEVFVETHHIFVPINTSDPAEEAAALEEILRRQARLRAGETFEAVAANNGDGTARTGGRLGRISVLDLDSTYSRAALGLENGGVSEPVRSSFGYHLIRLDAVERRPVDDAQSIRDRVLFDIRNERAAREQDLYLDRIRSEAFVEYRVEVFDFYCPAVQ